MNPPDDDERPAHPDFPEAGRRERDDPYRTALPQAPLADGEPHHTIVTRPDLPRPPPPRPERDARRELAMAEYEASLKEGALRPAMDEDQLPVTSSFWKAAGIVIGLVIVAIVARVMWVLASLRMLH